MTTAAQSGAERRILCPVLIGRDVEMGRLGSLLRECLGGHGRTALVSGEAGVGKTAMLRHFVQQARADGARVLLGECTEIDARRPFGPFMEIARAANRVASLPTADKTTAGSDRYRLHSAFTPPPCALGVEPQPSGSGYRTPPAERGRGLRLPP